MKRNILVSGASGIVGYGILRSLVKNRDEYHLIGTSIYEESIAPAFCDVFELAIPTNDNNYIDWLCDIIKKHNIDMIIPSIEADMYLWNENREKILSSGAFPLLNSYDLIDLCKDKWVFYNKLVESIPELLIPTTDNVLSKEFGFPCIFKPKRGFGSKGIIRVKDKEDYDIKKEKIGNDLIMQPIIGTDDDEYTVSGFFDNKHNLLEYFTLKRKLSPSGYTEIAQVDNYDFSEILVKIAAVVKPVGPTNFQFRLDNKSQMKLLEINPRVSSSTSIRMSLGYNESDMSIKYFLEGQVPEKIDKSSIQNRKAIRYIEEYIF